MDSNKILFTSKIYREYSFDEKIKLPYLKNIIFAIILLFAAFLLYLINDYYLQNDILYKINVILIVFSFVLFLVYYLETDLGNELKFGEIVESFLVTESFIQIGDTVFSLNELYDIKYIVADFKGKEPPFHRVDLEFNILSRKYGKGILNWICFTHKGKHYKKYFFLENIKHLEGFHDVMGLLDSKDVKIIKALEY
jgi:hypothetical protein